MDLKVTGLNGSVKFNRDGVHSGRANGTALGGPIAVNFTPQPAGVLAEIESTSKGSGIAAWLGEQYHGRVGGEVAWRVRWNMREGWGGVRVEAPTLKTLSLRLPAPLAYEKGLPDKRATVRFVRHRSGAAETIVQAGDIVSARLLSMNVGGKSKIKKGEISVGGVPAKLPDRDRLELAVRGKLLELDGWIELLAAGTSTSQTGGLEAVRGQFDNTRFLGRDFGQLAGGLYRRGEVWSGRLAGERLAGAFRYDREDKTTRVTLDLLSLNVPKAAVVTKKVGDTSTTDPRRLPIIQIKAKKFVYEDADFGELDLRGQPMATGWKIEQLKLTRPEADGLLTGEWQVIDRRQRSHIAFTMESRDIAATNKAIDVRGLLGSGSYKATGDLRWPGGFADFDMGRSTGKVKSTAKDGSLTEVKQGAVKLLGALDISALLKYLTLDFKPLVEEGFLYSSMKFNATVENGNLYTDDFYIKGQSADIKASGRVGIAAEDLDLVLEVSPHVGTGAALAGWWFFGPQAGAIALAIQQIFKRTGTGVRVVYQVKGPWEKPVITREVTDDEKQVEKPADGGTTSGTDE